MIWGGFSFNGTTDLAIFSSLMSSEGYTDTIETNPLPRAEQITARNWVFQQDSAPIHVSRHTKNWFSEEQVQVLEWLPRSPGLNLNAIENLWAHLREGPWDGRQYSAVSKHR